MSRYVILAVHEEHLKEVTLRRRLSDYKSIHPLLTKAIQKFGQDVEFFGVDPEGTVYCHVRYLPFLMKALGIPYSRQDQSDFTEFDSKNSEPLPNRKSLIALIGVAHRLVWKIIADELYISPEETQNLKQVLAVLESEF